MLTRRQWISLAALFGARSARAEMRGPLTAREVLVPNSGGFGGRCLLLRPTRVPEEAPLPLVVLLHGLAETANETLGIRAWFDRYGLPEAYARLTTAPVVRTLPREHYLSEARLQEINQELLAEPFPDLALVCPFAPNVWKEQASAPVLDRYAQYLERALLPAVRAATPTCDGPMHLGLDGVSLGGYLALEIFLRKPQLFGVVGCMQGAFGSPLVASYARRLAEVVAQYGARSIHLTTTSLDPFRDATQRLAGRLSELGLPVTLTLADGPHDQRFLREAGTLEMLLYQARALNRD
jgi:pimeloyl-ACP methyl ester carboxylesterase